MSALSRQYFFIGVLAGLFVVNSCGLFQPEDTTPPDQPVMLAHGPDTVLGEWGITSMPDNNHIKVVWLPVNSDDMAGYRLYRYRVDETTMSRDTAGTDNLLLDTAMIGGGNDTIIWIDATPTIGKRYNYYVRAYDESGNESTRSRAVTYKLIKKIPAHVMEAPRGDVHREKLTFRVIQKVQDPSIFKIIIKVYDVNLGRVIWSAPPQEAFWNTILPYNADSSASKELTAERHYRWRVDALGTPSPAGSKSNWIDFYMLD